jgi:hypothetical protein
MERIMACQEGERLEGMFGLSGLGSVGSFAGLHRVLRESGFAGCDDHVKALRLQHARKCACIKAALPVAVEAAKLVAADPGLSGNIFKKIGKAIKKVGKTLAKVDPGHMLVKAISPSLAHKLDPLFVDAPKAKAAKAVIAAGVAPGTDPLAAGAAVLAAQSGVPLTTPAAQDFGQQLVQSAGGGGGAPSASLPMPAPEDAADDGLILGMTPLVAAGAGVAVAGGLYLLLRRKGRR